jgi:trk system potassium uptake protein TrkA
VRSLANKLDCTVLHQEGNSLDALRKAGAADADVFVAVTDSDEVNMVTCGLVSGEFNVACKIARIRNINYSDAASSTHNFLGIDAVVNPEAEASRELIQSIEHGAMGDVILFAHSRLQIRSLPVSHTSVAVGKPFNRCFKSLRPMF